MRVGFLSGLALIPVLSNAYWLMPATNFITTARLDPIVTPNGISGHAHSVIGGQNFGSNVTTAKLQQSGCTSTAVNEDFSDYWFPQLYFQWKNGSFSSVDGGPVLYYFFPDKSGTAKAFPNDFRMISGDPFLRKLDPNNAGQKAITFLCIQGEGQGPNSETLEMPSKPCSFSLRSQIYFPNCWDGKNLDSSDHKSHVAFPKVNGAMMTPNSGVCEDPKFPVMLPQILLEVYWNTRPWDGIKDQAMNPSQPYVFSQGDSTGYGNHADFYNGWQDGVLQKAVDGCNCHMYGDPACCVEKGIFTITRDKTCHASKSTDEQTIGTLMKLAGNNPVNGDGEPAGGPPGPTPVSSAANLDPPAPTPPTYGAPAPSPSSAPASSPTIRVEQPALAPPSPPPPAAPPAQPPANSTPSRDKCKKTPHHFGKSKRHARRGLEQGLF